MVLSLPRTHTAFGAALALHFVLMWYSARLDTLPAPLEAPKDAHAAVHVSLIEVTPSPNVMTAPRPGQAAGEDEGAGPPPPVAKPVVVKPVVAAAARERTPAVDTDLFSLDTLLEADDAVDSIAVPPRPRAARTQLVRRGVRGSTSKGNARLGAGKGKTGSGSGAGGSGGTGSGFGGSHGHFRGQVCFIEPGTKALRQLGACQVQGEFFTDVFNISARSFTSGFPGVSDRSEWFAILYTGVLITLDPGDYRFRVVSDDGAILRIDGEVVVDNDGQHGPVSKAALKFLSRGSHQLELRYFQGPRTMVALQVFVTPPDKPEQLLRGTL